MILILEDHIDYKEHLLDMLDTIHPEWGNEAIWVNRAEDAMEVLRKKGSQITLAILDIDLGGQKRERDGLKVGQFIESNMRENPNIAIAVLYLTNVEDRAVFNATGIYTQHRLFLYKRQIQLVGDLLNALEQAHAILKLLMNERPARTLILLNHQIRYQDILWISFKEQNPCLCDKEGRKLLHQFTMEQFEKGKSLYDAGLVAANKKSMLVYMPNVTNYIKEDNGRYLRLFFSHEVYKQWNDGLLDEASLAKETVRCSRDQSREIKKNWLVF